MAGQLGNSVPQVVANIPKIDGNVMRLTNQGRLLPFIKDSVFCEYGKNFFTTFAEYWMDKDYVSSTEIYHVENNLERYTIRVTADVTSTQDGGAVEVSYGSNVGNTGLANLQPGYFVSLPPLNKLAKVIDLNTNTKKFTIVPADDFYRITLKQNNELIIIPASIVASCGCTDLPSSIKTPGMLYKSTMGIIEKQLTICGEDLPQWLESRTQWSMKSVEDPCKDVDIWWHAELDQMWYEFQMAKQMITMTGEDITNDNPTFAGTKSPTGVLHILRSRAVNEPVSANTGIDLAYFKRINKLLKKVRNHCTQYGWWMGSEHRGQIDTALEGKVVKNDITWGFLQNDIQRGIRFGFDAVKIDGIEHYFHDEESFNDLGFMGADGFNGPNTTIGIPLCKMQCQGRGQSTPIVINYLAGNGINRELIENDYGILRPSSNESNCDYHKWQLKSQFGIDVYCPNRFFFTESI